MVKRQFMKCRIWLKMENIVNFTFGYVHRSIEWWIRYNEWNAINLTMWQASSSWWKTSFEKLVDWIPDKPRAGQYVCDIYYFTTLKNFLIWRLILLNFEDSFMAKHRKLLQTYCYWHYWQLNLSDYWEITPIHKMST